MMSFHDKVLSRKFVQFVQDDIELLIADGGESPSFQDVLSYHTIGFLFKSSFLSRVGILEVEIVSQVMDNALMSGEFFPIDRDEVVNHFGLRPEQVDNDSFDDFDTLHVQSGNQG